ncbi:MAG TPA: TerC/Alx family metal homeostasis membrane protein [Kofleriaceae bacterium]|jgi:tellurite resistance protein TerC
MIWFWFGFFAFVAALLFLDLGVLHRKQETPTLKSAAWWTVAWVALGLSFTGFVYLMYENHWLGAELAGHPKGHPGQLAAIEYVSAYLLEQALSIDNIFVMALLFASFKVPVKYQHRVLFWGILGAIVFRVAMLGGGAYLATRFTWIFYVFGGYLAWQGLKLLRGGDEEEGSHERSIAVRILRRFVRIVDGDHGGAFSVRIDVPSASPSGDAARSAKAGPSRGKLALTTIAVCLVVIELTDVVFALDSIPAVLSVSSSPFVMITSNIFAIMGLRSLYFVLAGAMAKFQYLKLALAVLLIGIGAKMCLHDVYHVSHLVSLASIAGILGAGVLASVIASRRAADEAPRDP